MAEEYEPGVVDAALEKWQGMTGWKGLSAEDAVEAFARFLKEEGSAGREKPKPAPREEKLVDVISRVEAELCEWLSFGSVVFAEIPLSSRVSVMEAELGDKDSVFVVYDAQRSLDKAAEERFVKDFLNVPLARCRLARPEGPSDIAPNGVLLTFAQFEEQFRKYYEDCPELCEKGDIASTLDQAISEVKAAVAKQQPGEPGWIYTAEKSGRVWTFEELTALYGGNEELAKIVGRAMKGQDPVECFDKLFEEGVLVGDKQGHWTLWVEPPLDRLPVDEYVAWYLQEVPVKEEGRKPGLLKSAGEKPKQKTVEAATPGRDEAAAKKSTAARGVSAPAHEVGRKK